MVTLADSGVLFAKNSDRDANEAQFLDWIPAADHDEGELVRCTWIDIAQEHHTHAVLLSRPWWMWGAEIGANEHGVVIGNEAVFTTAAQGAPALLGMDLLRLALERACSADEAAGVIVQLLERHGQGGACSDENPDFTYHNSFLIADPQGAIVLETAGRDWASEVVSGRGRSISNGLTIAGFAQTHSDRVKSRVAACTIRRGITEKGASAADGPGDLMQVLRGHGASVGPTYSLLNGAMSAPCMHAGGLVASSQTTASWVSDLGAGPLHWVTGTAAPCTSIFKPVRVDTAIDVGPRPDNHAGSSSLWWRHEDLHRLAVRDLTASLARFGHERDRTERSWLESPPSGAAAFADAARLEQAWLTDLAAAALPDRRPALVRRYWARQDRAAGRAAATPSSTTAPVRTGAST